MRKTINIITFLSISSIFLWFSFPLFSFYTRGIGLLISFLVFFLSFSIENGIFKNLNQKWLTNILLIFFIIFLFYILNHNDYFFQKLIFVFYLLFALIIFSYLEKKDNKYKLRLLIIVSFSYILTTFISIVFLQSNPDSIRILTSGNSDLIMESFGVANFQTIYSLAYLTPVIFYLFFISNIYKSKPYILIFLILLFFSFLTLIFMSNLIISLLGTFFLIFSLFITRKNFVFLLSFLLIIILFLSINNSWLLNFININFNGHLKSRLIELYEFIFMFKVNPNSSLYSRLIVYLNSFNIFKESPFFGILFSSSITIPNHSDLIDLFAGFGFIFSLMILLNFIEIYKKTIQSKIVLINKINIIFYLFFGLLNPVLSVNVLMLQYLVSKGINYEKSSSNQS
jgi:hypothetical protein